MAKYKSPGIYVEEIPTFCSIASRENTAVFIGYTQKHLDEQGRNLQNTATEICSLLHFEKLFGTPQAEENIEIIDTSLSEHVDARVNFGGAHSKHNLPYSVRHFFDNGGRACKIISVGSFKNIGGDFGAEDLISGLKALKNEPRNYLIAIPESQSLPHSSFYQLQEAMLDLCAHHRSFAVLDLPKILNKSMLEVVADYRQNLQSPFLQFGAAYCPNITVGFPYYYDESNVIIKKNNQNISLPSLKTTNPERYGKYKKILDEFCVEMPPSPAVVGATLKNDSDRGVWTTPANIALTNVKSLKSAITNDQQQKLNIDPSGKSINCIRNFAGRGILIWGGRTLAGNDAEWKYIAVRRVANQIENDISQALQVFVFETNSAVLWVRTKSMIENYLVSLWKYGAMVGVKPEEAFFVKCGLGETMSAEDVFGKILIVQVGLAITRPAEFIIISFSQITA